MISERQQTQINEWNNWSRLGDGLFSFNFLFPGWQSSFIAWDKFWVNVL